MKHRTVNVRSVSGLARDRANHNDTVVLFGEVLADVFPERTVLGGAPFNVARHLRAFGQNPVLISSLGSDALHEEVLNMMTQCDMQLTGIQCDHSHPTGRVQVHIEENGHRFEILPLQAYDFILPEIVHKTVQSVHPALVYFGTLAQRNEVSRQALKTLLNNTEAVKFLDINLRTPWYDENTLRKSLDFANIVKLNDDELGILAEMFALHGSNPDEQVMDLMNRFNIEQIVITCGDKGAWQINKDGNKIEAGITKKITKLVDTVGAGDGFAAVCILGTLKQWLMNKTLERAISFAGAICGIRGAIPDHADFYEPFIQEWGFEKATY